MKLKNLEVFNAKEPLEKLMDLKLPVKVAYSIAKVARKIADQLAVIDKVRNGLVAKYGKPNKSGNMEVDRNAPEFTDFVVEFNELMDMEVEIVIDKVKLPDKDLSVEPKILMALEKFIEV